MAVALAWAGWIWAAGVVVAAFIGVFSGGERQDVAAASALALAPALIGFILLPLIGLRWGALALILAWIVALTGLVAGTGGWGSPLAAGLLIPVALARTLGRWTRIAGIGAVAGYAASGLAPLMYAGLGRFTVALTFAALVLIVWLTGFAQRRDTREAAAGQRIAEVSHELRTPLTHILGFSEMIERQIFGEIGSRYVEYAGLIRKSGTHLLGLVNDLLDLSRIDAGKFEVQLGTFDVRAVIEDVVRVSVDSAEKKQIALGMLTPEAALKVHADDRAVKRMLINTVSNAIKFTPEGGKVMVQASEVNGVLRLDTIDNGPGIPEAERAILGQAYERGSGGARAEGTGLGLSLVRALAALHGGTLSFHEAPGGGALVRITLPVLAD
ncbi:MAG: HAMP domain-containing histidine kinase [Hyphomonadaceae bacterium]|nr:HAMP domain-containing histidine kinase [Hyphomonadaceae bacterium]